MKPDGMDWEVYERYRDDWWNEEEIARIWEDTLTMRKLMREHKDDTPREITCANYKNAIKRQAKEVENWLHAKT